MKKEDFFNELVESMELEEINLTEHSVFREIEDVDSMAFMSIVALVDEKFGVTISAKDLEKIITVRDLMESIGMDKFE